MVLRSTVHCLLPSDRFKNNQIKYIYIVEIITNEFGIIVSAFSLKET